MGRNALLNAAAKAKKDQFYTQFADIQNEMKHYRAHFKGKTVLCNCDDPFESQFFQYFALKFNDLGLKKLIATSYVSSPIAGSQFRYRTDKDGQTSILFGEEAVEIEADVETYDPKKHAYKAVVTAVRDATGNDSVEMVDVAELFKMGENTLTELAGDGDFRSDECLALLDEADIVVTNPPFSLFREYVATLMEHGKKFLIIGNVNAITYKEIFPLLQENKIWLGMTFTSGNVKFNVPDDYPLYATFCGIDENGRKFIRVTGVRWFTNLDNKKTNEEMILVAQYSPGKYPKYANYDAIEVSKVANIPADYFGEMGVPITYLDKHNPSQFEIIGSSRWLGYRISEIAPKGSYVEGGMRFYLPLDVPEGKIKYKRLYDRLVIKRKKSAR